MKNFTLFLTAIFMLFFAQNTSAQGVSEICSWEFTPNGGGGTPETGSAAYVLFTWETLPNGIVEIRIYPHPDNLGTATPYGCFRGNNGGLATGGFSLSGGLAFGDYFEKSISVDKKKVILTPVQEIPEGTVINFNGMCEYKTNNENTTDNGNDFWPGITFPAYTYGTDCSSLPNITATPEVINFTPSAGTRTFALTGGNLTDDLTISASSNLTLSHYSLTPEADGTVNETITVTMDEYSATGNYIIITGGGLPIPASIGVTASGFSEYCKTIIGNDGGRAYFTITTSPDRTQMFFKITPYDQSENAAAAWTHAGVQTVSVAGANPQTATVTYSEPYYNDNSQGGNTLATATFDYAVPDGIEVRWGTPVWGTWGDESNDNGNNFEYIAYRTYTSGTGCTIRDDDLQLDIPTNIAVNEYGWLTFDEVDNATSYNVKIYFGTTLMGIFGVSGSGATITSPMLSGVFDVILTAIDNTGTYADSESSDPVSWAVTVPDLIDDLPPSEYCRVNIAGNVGSAIFSVETKSNGDIHITLDGENGFRANGVNINSFTLAGFNGSMILDKIGSNTVNPQVFRPKAGLSIPKGTLINYNGTIEWTAEGGYGTQHFFTDYIYGTSCEDVVAAPLDAPTNVEVNNWNFISFDEVANAGSYVVEIYIGENLLYAQTLAIDNYGQVQNQLAFYLPGIFNVKVKALPSVDNLTYYSESEFSDIYVWEKTVAIPPIIEQSVYCDYEYDPTNNDDDSDAALFTWKTNVNNQLVITIAPKDPDAQDAATFRANGQKGGIDAELFTINGISSLYLLEKINANQTEAGGVYSATQTFQGKNGFVLVPGLEITYNGEIEYRILPGYGNLYPTVAFLTPYMFGGSCSGPATVLTPPTNLVIDDNILTFDYVTDASSYTVYIYDEDGNLVSTIENFDSGNEIDYDVAGYYTLQVRAMGDGESTVSSLLSASLNFVIINTLETPVIVKINSEHNLTFTGVQNALSYTITVYQNENDETALITLPNFVNGSAVDMDDLPYGNYFVKIQAIGDGDVILDSELSDGYAWNYQEAYPCNLLLTHLLMLGSDGVTYINQDEQLQSTAPYFAPNHAPNSDYSTDINSTGTIINLDAATYGEWQAQFRLLPETPILLKAGTTYDFSVKIETNKNTPVYCKIFDQNDNIYVEFQTARYQIDGEQVLTLSNYAIPAGMDRIFQILFDFGGNAANTEIIISDFVICGEEMLVLDTPDNLSITESALTFDGDENATSFTVYIYDNEENIVETIENFVSGDVIDYNVTGHYTIKVQAIGDEIDYISSDLSASVNFDVTETLATPTNLNINVARELTFDAVSGAESYTVFIFTVTVTPEPNLPLLTLENFTIGSVIDMGELPYGHYIVIVQAIGDGDLILNSEFSDPYEWDYEIFVLDAPENLLITENMLTFNEVENASAYTVYIYDSEGELVKTIEDFVSGSEIDMDGLPTGAYTIKVQAIGDNVDYADSELSEPVEYNYVKSGLYDAKENTIFVFPNPVVNTLHINGTTATDAKIVDVLGKVQSVSLTNGSINVSTLVNGIYMLIIDNHTIKFVKK